MLKDILDRAEVKKIKTMFPAVLNLKLNLNLSFIAVLYLYLYLLFPD